MLLLNRLKQTTSLLSQGDDSRPAAAQQWSHCTFMLIKHIQTQKNIHSSGSKLELCSTLWNPASLRITKPDSLSPKKHGNTEHWSILGLKGNLIYLSNRKHHLVGLVDLDLSKLINLNSFQCFIPLIKTFSNASKTGPQGADTDSVCMPLSMFSALESILILSLLYTRQIKLGFISPLWSCDLQWKSLLSAGLHAKQVQPQWRKM